MYVMRVVIVVKEQRPRHIGVPQVNVVTATMVLPDTAEVVFVAAGKVTPSAQRVIRVVLGI
jgi:hypothetical protein